jgi:hypothetical protein
MGESVHNAHGEINTDCREKTITATLGRQRLKADKSKKVTSGNINSAEFIRQSLPRPLPVSEVEAARMPPERLFCYKIRSAKHFKGVVA